MRAPEITKESMMTEINNLHREVSELRRQTRLIIDYVKEETEETIRIRENTETLINIICTLQRKNQSPEEQNFEQIDLEKLEKLDLQNQDLFHLNISNLHNGFVYSPIELTNNRLATAGQDGSISICELNIPEKKCTQIIKRENAHNYCIKSICEIPGNKLISCSNDQCIKIWQISYPV